jgi:hypothetical protein
MATDEFGAEDLPEADEFGAEDVRPAPTVTAPTDPTGGLETFVTRAGRAVSMGLTDPASAAITAGMLDRVPGKTEPTFGEKYEYARQLASEREARREAENPTIGALGTATGTALSVLNPLGPEALVGKALAPVAAGAGRVVEAFPVGLSKAAGWLSRKAGLETPARLVESVGRGTGAAGRTLTQGAIEGAVPGAIYAGATEGLESVPEGAELGAVFGAGGQAALKTLGAGVSAARRSVGRSASEATDAALMGEGAGDIERARREMLADVRQPQEAMAQRFEAIGRQEARKAQDAANKSARIQVKLEDQIERLAGQLPEKRAAELRSLSEQLANVQGEIEGLDRSARAASAQMHQELFTRLSNYVDYAKKNNEAVPPEFLDQFEYLGKTLGQWTGPKLESLNRYRADREAWWQNYVGQKAAPLQSRAEDLQSRIAAKQAEAPDFAAQARATIEGREQSVLDPTRIANIYRSKGLNLPPELAAAYRFKEPPLASLETGAATTAAQDARDRARLAFEQTRTQALRSGPPSAPAPEELAELQRRTVSGQRTTRGLSAPEIGTIAGEAETAVPTQTRRAAYGGLLSRSGVAVTPRLPGVPSVRGMLLKNVGLDPAQASQFLALEPRTNRFKYPDEAFALLRDFESVIANDEKALAKFGPIVNRLGVAGALRTLLSTPSGAAAVAAAVPESP